MGKLYDLNYFSLSVSLNLKRKQIYLVYRGIKMASEAFTPLLNDTWINVFFWVFAIIGVSSIIWYVTYVKKNKDRQLQTSMRILLLTAISLAISIQMLLLKNRVSF